MVCNCVRVDVSVSPGVGPGSELVCLWCSIWSECGGAGFWRSGESQVSAGEIIGSGEQPRPACMYLCVSWGMGVSRGEGHGKSEYPGLAHGWTVHPRPDSKGSTVCVWGRVGLEQNGR